MSSSSERQHRVRTKEKMVPGGGFEPPTRGFSVRLVALVINDLEETQSENILPKIKGLAPVWKTPDIIDHKWHMHKFPRSLNNKHNYNLYYSWQYDTKKLLKDDSGENMSKKESLIRRTKEDFSKSLLFLINHRGYLAEQLLIKELSSTRLSDLLDGAEATFRETETISKILGVPLSTFQVTEEKKIIPLEIAFAEIMYASVHMSEDQVSELAKQMISLVCKDEENIGKILQFKKL